MPVNTCLHTPVRTSCTWPDSRGWEMGCISMVLKVLKAKSPVKRWWNKCCSQTQRCLDFLYCTSLTTWLTQTLRDKSVYTVHSKTTLLRLMWTPLRAAGCVYQWISTVLGANSAGLYTLTSINLLWPGWELCPPRGSFSLLLPPSPSISPPLLPLSLSLQPLFISPPSLFSHFLWLALLLVPRPTLPLPLPLPFPSISLPLSDLIPPLNLSCQVKHQERGSCELVRSEINKARTGWTIYPATMHFVQRMGTAGHKSCHAAVCWAKSICRHHRRPRHLQGA